MGSHNFFPYCFWASLKWIFFLSHFMSFSSVFIQVFGVILSFCLYRIFILLDTHSFTFLIDCNQFDDVLALCSCSIFSFAVCCVNCSASSVAPPCWMFPYRPRIVLFLNYYPDLYPNAK